MADKGERIQGGYVEMDAAIYYAREASEITKVSVLLHELYHAFEDHTSRMDEEAKADSFAAMIMRIFNVKKVDDILKALPNTKESK